MSTDRALAESSDLAGEASPSHSEGLRPDTRTSNSEDWEGPVSTNPPETTAAVKGDVAQVSFDAVAVADMTHDPTSYL